MVELPKNPTGGANLDFFERPRLGKARRDYDTTPTESHTTANAPPPVLKCRREGLSPWSQFAEHDLLDGGARIGMVGGTRKSWGLAHQDQHRPPASTGPCRLAYARSRATKLDPARNEIYRKRRDKLCRALNEIGIQIKPPKASLYLWAPVPEGFTSAEFAEQMLSQIGVAVTSGASYGKQGEGWFRISLTVSDEEVDQAVARFPKLALQAAVALYGHRGNSHRNPPLRRKKHLNSIQTRKPVEGILVGVDNVNRH